MTPNELLALPYTVEDDFAELTSCYCNHVPELKLVHGRLAYTFVKTESPELKLHVYAFKREDYRRYWKLYAAVFQGVHVMILRNAGREGDDHASRFVLDRSAYVAMLKHINQRERKLPAIDLTEFKLYPKHVDIENLASFYGESLLTDRKDGA